MNIKINREKNKKINTGRKKRDKNKNKKEGIGKELEIKEEDKGRKIYKTKIFYS